MKAMPLPFEDFQGKGVLDFSSGSSDLVAAESLHQKWKENCYVGSTEPTSVLDTRRSPSPPTSSSTLSSSHGSGGGSGSTDTTTTTTTTGVAAAAAQAEAVCQNNSSQTGLEEAKCGPTTTLGMEDWECVLSESPGQEQSILRFIMSDIEDPSLGLNKLLQGGGGSHQDLGFNAGFHDVMEDQGYGAFEELNSGNLNLGMSSIVDPSAQATTCSEFPFSGPNVQSNNAGMFSASANNLFSTSLPSGMFQQSQHLVESVDEKPQMVMNQNQAMFMPSSYAQLQEHHFLSPPPAKRHNSGVHGPNYPVQRVPFHPGQELLSRVQLHQQQLQLLPQQLHHRPTMLATKDKVVNNLEGKEMMNNNQLHQAIIDQLFNAAELIETGNPLLAQGILARLNQQLSPIGKPFQRAAFYFQEALQLLLNMKTSHSSANLSPFSLIYKIGAYKSFSEISPFLQFANFTCNQAILESVESFNHVHIIDFDIGYGGQWASFMHEVALRNGGAPSSLKISAFVCPSMYDEFELGFTQDNLKNFANELNLAFKLEIVSLESLNSGSWPLPHIPEGVAVAVNVPIGSFSNYPLLLPLVLRFVKQLSPKVVVSLERGSDRTDISFPHQIVQAIHCYSGLLESLDAVNANLDALQKIERYLLQPSIEKIVMGRHLSPKRPPTPSWRSLFLSSGFSPLTFSNFTESQAECLVQRTPVGGFHIEKRQSSLVLCWQRKDLISVSAWRC